MFQIRARLFAVGVLAGAVAYAKPPPPTNSPPPVAPRPPAWSQGGSAIDRLPREPNVWERIQDPLDRSMGRIVDEQTYQLDRLARERDEQLGHVRPQTEFERLHEERERWLRIDQRKQDLQKMTDRQRQAELDRREYNLFINSGLSPVGSQAFADQQALGRAKNERDQALIAAETARAEALRSRPADREKIEAEYQRRMAEIRGNYQKERERILGFTDTPPATQP